MGSKGGRGLHGAALRKINDKTNQGRGGNNIIISDRVEVGIPVEEKKKESMDCCFSGLPSEVTGGDQDEMISCRRRGPWD